MSDPRWPNGPFPPTQPGTNPQPSGPTAPSGAAAPPASSPWGAPPQPGAPPNAAQYPYGQQPVNPYAQPPHNPYANPPQNPYGQPGPAPFGAPTGNPYGQAPYYPPRPPTGLGGGGAVIARVVVGALVTLGSAGYGIFARGRANDAMRAANQQVTAAQSGIPRGVAFEPADPNVQLGAKLDQYIDHCLNRFSASARRSRDRYLSWVDRQAGPTGRERNVYGLFDISGDVSECQGAVASAAAMPPSNPALESAARGYATALASLVPLVQTASAYYSRQNYRDDGMANGRTMHAPLIAAFDAMAAADEALHSQIEPVQEQVLDAEINRIAADPSQRLSYLLRVSQRNARHMMKYVDQASVGADRKVRGLDAAQFQAMADAYEHGVDEMSQFARGHADQTGAIHGYSTYESSANAFVLASRELARRLRDNTAFTSSEMEEMVRWHRDVDGSPAKLASAYDDLVTRHNFLF